MRSSQSTTMDIMHNIRFLRTHVQKSYPTTNNFLILLAIFLPPIFTLTALVLLIFHVYFTGLWFYYNERIFVTRGFGEDDAAKCIDVLSETGLNPNTGALEWYWRMQCEGNRDAWGDEGIFDILNQQWIWTIFDTFWASFLAPCLHAMTYFTTTVSDIYDSQLVTLIATVVETCFNAAANAAATATHCLFWVISWASYFDWVPTIKYAFATIGDWLHASASTLVNNNYLPEKVSGIDSGVAEKYFSFVWNHQPASVMAVIAILGDGWNICIDYIDELSLNESFSHIVSVIKDNLVSVVVPKTGMPWGFIAFAFSVWISTHIHRNFIDFTNTAPKRSLHEHWTTWIKQISFAHWHWVEVSELGWRRIILPIAHDGVWNGCRYWVSRFVFVSKAIGRGSKRLSMSRAGIGLLTLGIASCIYLLVEFGPFRNVVFQVLAIAPASLLLSAMLTVFIFVLMEVYRITRRAIITIFNQESFFHLTPGLSDFWTRIVPVLLSQVPILLILRLFNIITSILRIPLTLTYTEVLIHAIVFDIFQVGDAFYDVFYLDVVARLSAFALHRVVGWVPIPWFWRPDYFLGAFPIPLFAWYTGYVTTVIYHSLYSVSWTGLPKNMYIGLCLLMSYLRAPGHGYLAKLSPIKLITDLREAVITKVQAFVAVLAILVFAYLKYVNIQAATYYCLLWGTYLLRNPKLPSSSPNRPLISSLDASPELGFFQHTLRKAVGIPISYLSILPVLNQFSGEPYMDLEAFLFTASGGAIIYHIYDLFISTHNADPNNFGRLAFTVSRNLKVLSLVVAALVWLYLRLKRFAVFQSVISASLSLVQPLTFIPVVTALYFLYNGIADDVIPPRIRTAAECIFQIGAGLLTVFALPYLSFTVAFYAVAVPGLLLYFYLQSPATTGLTRRSQPHGLQSVFWDEPVPAWAKHLWWIIPLSATWESLQILQHYGAIHQHFQEYDSAFFFEAWASSSTIASIAVIILMIVTFLVHVVQEQHALKFLWSIGKSVTSYLPFNTRPLRDATLFGAGSGSTYQGRQPTGLIQAWIVLVLQAYRPGAWSLVVSMLLGDIIKINKPSSEGSPVEIPVPDDGEATRPFDIKFAPSNDEIKTTDDQRARAAAAAARRTISKAHMSDQSPFATVEDDDEDDENNAVGVTRTHDHPVKDEADAIKPAYLADGQARPKHPRRFSKSIEDNSADDFGLDPEGDDQMSSDDDDEGINAATQENLPRESPEKDNEELSTPQSSTKQLREQPAAQKGSGPSM